MNRVTLFNIAFGCIGFSVITLLIGITYLFNGANEKQISTVFFFGIVGVICAFVFGIAGTFKKDI